MSATPRPWVWGEAEHLGTAQEEFDIATGYWKKWQRCEEEKAQLLRAVRRARAALVGYDVPDIAGNALIEELEQVIAKAEAP